MNKIEDLENHFSEQSRHNYGYFECPKCNKEWGWPNYNDPPFDMDVRVRCSCSAVLSVSGEWFSTYDLSVDLVDE